MKNLEKLLFKFRIEEKLEINLFEFGFNQISSLVRVKLAEFLKTFFLNVFKTCFYFRNQKYGEKYK